MTISAITEKLERRAGDESPLTSSGVMRTRTVLYDALHDASDSDDVIMDDLRVPQPKQIFGPGEVLLVTRRQRRRITPILSEIEIIYEAPSVSFSTNNPLDVEAVVTYRTESVEDICSVDVDGNPIQTITEEPFEPLLTETYRFPVIRIEKNIPFDPGPVIEAYMTPLPATNSDSYRGRPPGTLIMWDMTASSVPWGETYYWKLVVEMAYRGAAPDSTANKAWWRRLKAQGYWMRFDFPNPAPGGPDHIFIPAERNGQPLSQPALHNKETGALLLSGDDPQWYEFQTKSSLPFSGLPL